MSGGFRFGLYVRKSRGYEHETWRFRGSGASSTRSTTRNASSPDAASHRSSAY